MKSRFLIAALIAVLASAAHSQEYKVGALVIDQGKAVVDHPLFFEILAYRRA